MTAMQLTQYAATGDIEGGKQAGRAVTLVIVATALALPGTHGQQGRGTIERLNLALFVHAQHQRAVGWVEVEANNVTDFVDEQRIAA